MQWIAIAATIENEVVMVHDDFLLLEEISEFDFQVIVKIYSFTDEEVSQLKQGNFDYKIKFNNLRSTYLEKYNRSDMAKSLTKVYVQRLKAIVGVRGRFEHALNRHKHLLSSQQWIYDQKAEEAKRILDGETIDGFVSDYATEFNLDIKVAATLVLSKYQDQREFLRKIERLRLRHLAKIKKAVTEKEFSDASYDLDKDFFLNMLL